MSFYLLPPKTQVRFVGMKGQGKHTQALGTFLWCCWHSQSPRNPVSTSNCETGLTLHQPRRESLAGANR